MMKRTAFNFLLAALLLTSCDRVYREYDKDSFPTYTWKSGQEVIFNPTIEDATKSYELVLGLRHVFGLKIRTLAINVRQISPSGKETTNEYQLTLIDDKGEYISSCGGDLCDIEVAVASGIKFEEAGTYKFVVTHNMPIDRIPGIMEVGLIINRQE
jgi:gliding motility-associated lipoprotein GldH